MPASIKIQPKDSKIQKSNSSILQNQIITFEEEKRMREEKQKMSDSINQIFRKYEKAFGKAFKRSSNKNEFSDLKKKYPHFTRTMNDFENLFNHICRNNPQNSFSFLKLWIRNEKINDKVFFESTEDKKKYSEAINKSFNDILME